MGVFIHNDITDRGRILLGEAQVGGTFEATKIVMGSGFIPSGYTARTMTGVVAPVIELAINKKKRAGDGTVTFGGVFSNKTLAESFYFREFALYARVKRADGTYSDEVCYTYGNAGDNADLLPGYSVGDVVEKQMDLVTYIGNDTEVNLTVESGIYTPHAERHAIGGEDPITPAMIGALAKITAKSNAYDMDAILAGGAHLEVYDTNADTLGTPYKYGKTALTAATILSYANGVNFGIQFAWLAGGVAFMRGMENGVISEWGDMATAADFIRKAGDDVNGELFFKNMDEYFMLKKGRTLPNGKTHFLTMGLSSGGSTTLEHYTCPTPNYDSSMLDGRLELGQVAGANGWLNPYALVLRSDNANGPTYRIFGEHYSPAVTATAELI